MNDFQVYLSSPDLWFTSLASIFLQSVRISSWKHCRYLGELVVYLSSYQNLKSPDFKKTLRMSVWDYPNYANWCRRTCWLWVTPFPGFGVLHWIREAKASWVLACKSWVLACKSWVLACMHELTALCFWLWVWHSQFSQLCHSDFLAMMDSSLKLGVR